MPATFFCSSCRFALTLSMVYRRKAHLKGDCVWRVPVKVRICTCTVTCGVFFIPSTVDRSRTGMHALGLPLWFRKTAITSRFGTCLTFCCYTFLNSFYSAEYTMNRVGQWCLPFFLDEQLIKRSNSPHVAIYQPV